MRKMVIWYGLLNKRLFQKRSFLLVLCMVPVLMLAMRYVAAQDSGMMTIALAVEEPEDAFAAEILDQLAGREDVLRYIPCETQEEAIYLVERNQADAAWIFPENLKERLIDYVKDPEADPVVRIVERESSTALNFTREILSNALYPDFAYEIYKDYITDKLGVTDMTEQELRENFENYVIPQNIFEMGYLDETRVEESNYLMAPMRGLLSIWLLLCGFAATLYFMQDEEKGIYTWFPVKNRVHLAYGVQGVLLTDGVVLLVAACFLGGIQVSLLREVLSAVLFALCILGFCNVLRFLCAEITWLASAVPVLIMGMALLSPVFIDLKQFGALRYIFPPIYYLKSIHNTNYLYWMLAYAAGMYVLCQLLYVLRNRGRK